MLSKNTNLGVYFAAFTPTKRKQKGWGMLLIQLTKLGHLNRTAHLNGRDKITQLTNSDATCVMETPNIQEDDGAPTYLHVN